MIDLHTHTSKSDGQYAPRELVDKAAAAGVTALAITDHDTVFGVAEGAARAAGIGMAFIPGIEISVEGNRELHILGYYIDDKNAPLLALCADFIRLRDQREGRIFEYLRARGVELTEEQVKKHVAGGGATGRPHFARAMVEAGYATSVQDAFDKHLATKEFSAIERSKPPARDGIAAILAAGGVPVLAHPALLKLDDGALAALVGELKGYGLAGVECYYSRHTDEQTAQYLALAEKYDLIVTGGSDFHGEQAKPGVALGDGARKMSADREAAALAGLAAKRGRK